MDRGRPGEQQSKLHQIIKSKIQMADAKGIISDPKCLASLIQQRISISLINPESLAAFPATYSFTHSNAIQVLLSYNYFCQLIKMLGIKTGTGSTIRVH